MRLPRMTIRQWMVLVAVVAVVTAWLVTNVNWDWSLSDTAKPFVCDV
jgi:hypothetical protein